MTAQENTLAIEYSADMQRVAHIDEAKVIHRTIGGGGGSKAAMRVRPSWADDLEDDDDLDFDNFFANAATRSAHFGRDATCGEWQLVWCSEKCFKSESKSLLNQLCEISECLGGVLVPLKKARRFSTWARSKTGTPTDFVLLADWREAKPCVQVLAQLEERERPSMVVILYEQRKAFARAKAWAESLLDMGFRTPVRVVQTEAEVDEVLRSHRSASPMSSSTAPSTIQEKAELVPQQPEPPLLLPLQQREPCYDAPQPTASRMLLPMPQAAQLPPSPGQQQPPLQHTPICTMSGVRVESPFCLPPPPGCPAPSAADLACGSPVGRIAAPSPAASSQPQMPQMLVPASPWSQPGPMFQSPAQFASATQGACDQDQKATTPPPTPAPAPVMSRMVAFQQTGGFVPPLMNGVITELAASVGWQSIEAALVAAQPEIYED